MNYNLLFYYLILWFKLCWLRPWGTPSGGLQHPFIKPPSFRGASLLLGTTMLQAHPVFPMPQAWNRPFLQGV